MHQAASFSFANPPNIAALLEAPRKNAAALTQANLVAFDGLKTLAQRQGDLLKATVDDCSKATSDVLAAASFDEKAARQADAARYLYASSFARARELTDIVLKANVAALDILNARVAEAFDELKALFALPAAPAPASIAEPDAAPPPVIADPVAVEEEAAAVVDETVAPVEPEPTAPIPAVEPEPIVEPAPRITAAPTRPPRKPTRPPRRPTSRG